ncbi:MucR family transcriptional regulator [Methylorubrum aminovorans]|uniref:MucR family transcriptional regulator n=1 Tax=Methylorubrum aminovorans TaxID=269069 RepID=UPI0023E9DC01|nr:hypothetical protein GCM10025880_12990 [Methylorubrum aminovorans]
MVDETGSSVETTDRLDLTAMIAAAYVSNSTLPPAELPRLVADVHRALLACDRAGAVSQSDANVEFMKPTPAQIKNSITPNGLISFIDGKAYAMLKRHLGKNGLDASGYRALRPPCRLSHDFPELLSATVGTVSGERAREAHPSPRTGFGDGRVRAHEADPHRKRRDKRSRRRPVPSDRYAATAPSAAVSRPA